MPKINHYQTIDIIRAISAVLIILYHYTYRYNENLYIMDSHLKTSWPYTVSWGYGAVITFFILSGYLLAKYFDMINVYVFKFIVKRMSRLYPTYWVCMSITTVFLFVLFPEAKLTMNEYMINLTMLASNFKVRLVDGAYWTMAYEIKFVIIFSTILLIQKNIYRKYLIAMWLIVSIISSFWSDDNSVFLKMLRVLFIVNWSQTFIVGLSIYQIQNSPQNKSFFFIVLGLCVINQLLWNFSFVHDVFLIMTMVLLFLMPYIETIKFPKRFFLIIKFVASISYPLYLLHQMIGFAIIKHLQSIGLKNETWLFIPIYICVCVGWAIHKYVEIPTSKLIK